MKILIDENMPYAKALFAELGEVITKAGRSIVAKDLVDIDALMCRSVTQVDAELLAKANKLTFVGTATAGVDHIDTELLAKKGIIFCSALGCNKIGVAEYVLSALMTLAWQQDFALTSRKVGIIGAGMVGSYLASCLEALNIPYMLCDPIKEKQGDSRAFVPLNILLKDCDVISLHTPLTYEGEYKTHHLIAEQELASLKKSAILINTSRGAVVDNGALKKALQNQALTAVLDVFEHEPLVDTELLPLLSFATPHIAGYGLEGKARGTTMIFNAFCDHFFPQQSRISTESLLPPAPISQLSLSQSWQSDSLFSLCQLVYDIRRDDTDFRRVMFDSQNQRVNFDQLRKNYWDRREYSAIRLVAKAAYGVESLTKLGFKLEIVE